MAPKVKEGKAVGKSKAEERAPTTKLEFGYPADLTNALKAISDRATQDLWQSPGGNGGGDPTAEQIAQRHANLIHKLSKRIAGDVRAKDALKSALIQWTASLGHHLAALVPRVKAISQKLDDDLSEACQEMQTAAVISSTSQDKIQQAQMQLGPTWSSLQEQEIYRIAGALRAFGAVQPLPSLPASGALGSDGVSAASAVTSMGQGMDVNLVSAQVPMSPMSASSTPTLGRIVPALGEGVSLPGSTLSEGRVSPMAEAAFQEYQRSTWEEPTEGRATSLDLGGNRQDARGGRSDGCHRDRGGCRAAPRRYAAVGAALMVYFLVAGHILCRQSRLRIDWQACFQCRTRFDVAPTPRPSARRSHCCAGSGTLGGLKSDSGFAERRPHGGVVCSTQGISADGEVVSECSPTNATGIATGCAGNTWPYSGSVQLCAIDSPRMVIPQLFVGTWWSLRWLYTSSCLGTGSRSSACNNALPVCSDGPQPTRQQRTVGFPFSIGFGIGTSCVHAHCRGILLPWLLLLGFTALLLGLLWGMVQRVPFVSGINGLALHLARRCTRFAAAGNARGLHLFGRHVTARRRSHPGGPALKPRSVRCLRCKGCFMLWMVLTPQVHGVQVVRQGAIHGQPVFSTGTVPGTRNLQDLRPVRVPNLPVTGPDSLVVDDGYRDICVFAPDLRGCHTALLVDVRLRGRALEVSICRALGRQAAEWECCRLLEALPALPPEQYVLRRTSVSWHLSVVPVDLRPIGGTIALAYADRVMPCGAIAHMAIADQPSLGCPEDFLCRTSQGWFAPDAALLLLPHCDAFQVWPLHLTQSAPPPATLSLLRQTSGSELLATSLEPTEGVERAYSHHLDGQAVIIARNGLVYVPITAYADQDSIRSSALLTYLGPSGLGIEYGGLTHFARVLPPLPDLPAVQFVAGSCDGHGQPTVVDLRAIQGSLHVCCTDSDATPAQRIEAAIHSGGEPDPTHPVIARLSQGMLQVLHREQAVSPFAPLLAPPPAPLVVLRRHSNVGTGWDDAHTTLGDTSHAQHFSVAASFCLIASVLSGPAPRFGWAAVFLLRCGLSAFSGEAVLPPASSDDGGTPAPGTYDGWQTFDAKDDRLTEAGSLVSAEEHVRLALRLYCSPSGSPLGWDTSSSSTGVRTAFFRFVVWSPHGQHVAFLPKDSTFAHAHDLIGRLRAMPDRGKPVLVQPQAFMHAVQLVSPSNDPGLITVLVDTGHDKICLDVSRKTVGASILSALSLLCPGHTFQLDPQLPVTARSGHVVLACHDSGCEVDMGTCVVPFPNTARHSWLQKHDEVLLTAADLGLVRLKVPRGYCMQRLQTAVRQWLGKSRCAGVRLQQVHAPGVGLSIFCLPRPGASTLTVVLSDICDSLGAVLVATVDSPTEGALPLSHLLHGSHSEFWKDVLSRDPSPRTCVQIPAAQSATGFPYVQVKLGLDYARARLHGWRPGLVSQVHTADLVGHAGALGIHWDILDDIRRDEAAVQTVPLHWPIQASPLVSVSAPVRRWAQRCIPAEGFFPAGTYYQLECPFMGVMCQVPCLPQYHLWAVRLADDVYGACTRSITWHDIAQVAGITAWDLPQTLIHEGMLSWEWPQDLTALSGHCGQVFCQGDVVEKRQDCVEPFSPEHRDLNDDAVSMPDVGPAVSGRHSVASLAILSWRYHGSLFGFLMVLTLPMLVGGASDDSPDQVSSTVLGEVGYGFNSTQTCSVAWCHELACQSTHFAVTAHSLAAYFRAHSPFEIVRILLWKPLAGPLALT